MRALVAIVAVLVCAPASAAQVRVKSEHPTARVAGTEAPSYKVGAEQVLRGAIIGPSSVRVLLRRLAPAGAGPIAVTLRRDGREVGRLLVGGKPIDRVTGEAVLASAPVEKQIDVPGGPHTLFLEVGQGEGEVLVAFEEPPPFVPAPLVKRTPKRHAPQAKKDPKKDPEKQAAATAGQPAGGVEKAGPSPESPEAASAKDKSSASAGAPTAPAEDQRSASAAGQTSPEAAPAEDQKSASAHGHTSPEAAAAPKTIVATADRAPGGAEPATGVREPAGRPPRVGTELLPRARVPRRLFVGLRAGGVSQPQIAAFGPAAGLTARWAIFAPTAKPATGPFVGLSADFLRYQASWSIPRSALLPAHAHELSVTAVPLLAEATWSFALGPAVPFVGGSLGLTVASVGSHSKVANATDSGALFSAGVHAGVEIPFGTDRLGLELRWLHANTGDNAVARDLQVGGFLAQASWRFGI
ncbi:MAG: hypothetical protein ACOX6T_21815 [Myxococcales bacterium]|jgi:hypothetical protein